MYRYSLVYQRTVTLLFADYCLDVSRRKPPVRVQLFAGYGVETLNVDALGYLNVKAEILVKVKVVYLYIEKVLPAVYPVVAFSDGLRYFPAAPRGTEFFGTLDRYSLLSGCQTLRYTIPCPHCNN